MINLAHDFKSPLLDTEIIISGLLISQLKTPKMKVDVKNLQMSLSHAFQQIKLLSCADKESHMISQGFSKALRGFLSKSLKN